MSKVAKISSISVLSLISFLAGFALSCYNVDFSESVRQLFKRPTVSVVMSSYNRAEALKHAVDSILNQTMKDFELIVVDDGSTDHTSVMMKKYAENDPRVVFIRHEKNQGLVAGLNSALDKARGKYIVRMDDDDKSLPFRLERQVLAMEMHPEITLMGAGFAGEGTQMRTTPPEIMDPDELEIQTYFSSGLAHPTIIFRRDFIEDHDIRYDETYLYAEDCGLYKKILENDGKISSMSEGVLIFGHVRNLQKPDKYSWTQSESFKKLQKDKLKPFFDAPMEILGAFNGNVNRCKMLKEMVAENPKHSILNQDLLVKRLEKTCPPNGANAIYVMHRDWETFVVLKDDKEAYRVDVPTEKATIVSKSDSHITLKWHNYPNPESFTKSPGIEEYKLSSIVIDNKTSKGVETKHPYWSDNLIFDKGKKHCYRESAVRETCTVLSKTKYTMTLKWDNWAGSEIFKIEKGGSLKYLKDGDGNVK